MIMVFPQLSAKIDLSDSLVNSLIIENPKLLYGIVSDLFNQSFGLDGHSLLFENDSPLSVGKNVELLTQFFPFELNQKSLLGKINSELEKRAISDEFCYRTSELLGIVEEYLADIAFDYNCRFEFPKLSIASIIKAGGIEIQGTGDSLCEKILDYMDLVSEFLGKRVFVLVNLRSFLLDDEMSLFMKTILDHGYEVLLIESVERKRLTYEKRYLVDDSLCEIC